jgi:hypothetical protein
LAKDPYVLALCGILPKKSLLTSYMYAGKEETSAKKKKKALIKAWIYSGF